MRKIRQGSAAWLNRDRRSSLVGAKRHGWRSSPRTLAVRNMPRFESLEHRWLLSGDPIISEFLASNSTGLLDEDGDSSDWIEVANPNAEPVDLGGWFLTDDADNLQRWKFPESTIEPYGRVLVFASGKNRTESENPLHTSFKLGAGGEFLALVKPDGTSVASQFAPEFPQQRTDVSFGTTVIEEVTELVSPESQAKLIVPSSDFNAEIGQSWRTDIDFDDSVQAGWKPITASVGFSRHDDDATITGTVAQSDSRGSSRNASVFWPPGLGLRGSSTYHDHGARRIRRPIRRYADRHHGRTLEA